MSDYRTSFGMMAPLREKLSSTQRQTISEALYEAGTKLNINYEGTLVYSDLGGERSDGEFGGLVLMIEDIQEHFDDTTVGNDLRVQFERQRYYSCVWYDGSDSDMDELTIEEFDGKGLKPF